MESGHPFANGIVPARFGPLEAGGDEIAGEWLEGPIQPPQTCWSSVSRTIRCWDAIRPSSCSSGWAESYMGAAGGSALPEGRWDLSARGTAGR